MRRIHIISDLHIEFSPYIIPDMEDEKNIVVVLAGDIFVVSKKSTYGDFLVNANGRFKAIIYICGNHEHYSGKFPLTVNKLKEYIKEQKLNNVYILEKETMVIDDVAFIGATLWTDMDKNNPMTMWDVRQIMNDYKRIRTGPKNMPWRQKLKPLDTMADHQRAKEYIFPEIQLHKKEGRKVVVVTHHLPSFESVDECYKGDKLNGAYA